MMVRRLYLSDILYCKVSLGEPYVAFVTTDFNIQFFYARMFDEVETSVRQRYWRMTLKCENIHQSTNVDIMFTMSSSPTALEGLCQNLGSLEISTLSANEKKQLRNSTKVDVMQLNLSMLFDDA